MKKITLILILLSFLYTHIAFASYKFEDYEWGTSMDNIEQQLKQKKKKIIKESFNTFLYYDKIFDRQCEVRLHFTPKTKLLAIIEIKWNSDTFSAVSNILESKYGKPFVPEYKDEFWWGYWDSEIIVLKPIFTGTSLKYISGVYKKQGEKELDEINSKDAHRF